MGGVGWLAGGPAASARPPTAAPRSPGPVPRLPTRRPPVKVDAFRHLAPGNAEEDGPAPGVARAAVVVQRQRRFHDVGRLDKHELALLQLLRARGIMKGESKYYVSLAHTQADVDHAIAAWTEAVAELAAGG